MFNIAQFKHQFVLALHRRKAIAPKQTELRRCLNTLELVSFGIGSIVGSGIFVLTGVAAATKAGPAIVISFAFAGVLSMLNALFYAELACRVPQTGSAYRYAYTSVGEVVAWIIGWDLTLEYMIGSAAVARGWSGYCVLLFESFNVEIPDWLHKIDLGNGWELDLLAALSVILFSILLCIGTRKSSLFNGVLVATKLIAIIFVIVVGIVYAESKNWDTFFPFGVQGIFSGAAVVFFAFIGFDSVCAMSEECKNPTRDLPIGIIGSLTVSSVLYILTAIVVTLLVPYYSVDLEAPLTSAFQDKGLQWAVVITSIGAFAGLSTAELGGLIAQPRIFYSLGEDGLLPAWFAKVHPRFQTPLNSTIVCGGLTALVSLFFGIDVLSEMVSIGTLMAFTIVACCVVTIRYKADIPPVDNSLKQRMISYCQRKIDRVCAVIVIMSTITSFCVVYSAPIVVRLAVWLAVGMIIYLSYGMKHSKLLHAQMENVPDNSNTEDYRNNNNNNNNTKDHKETELEEITEDNSAYVGGTPSQ